MEPYAQTATRTGMACAGVALSSTALIIAGEAATAAFTRYYAPLRTNSNARDRWQSAFAAVHIIGVMVAHSESDFSWLRDATSCRFWSVLVATVLGLAPWLVLLLARMAQSSRLNTTGRVSVCGMVVLFTAVSLGSGVVFFPVMEPATEKELAGGCQRGLGLRIIVSVWSMVMATVLGAFAGTVSDKTLEFQHLRVFAAFAFSILLAMGIGSLVLEDTDWGNTRCLTTALFHLIITVAIRGPMLFRAARNDLEFSKTFERSPDGKHANPRSLAEAEDNPRCMVKFFRYIGDQAGTTNERDMLDYMERFYNAVTQLLDRDYFTLEGRSMKDARTALRHYASLENVPECLVLKWEVTDDPALIRLVILTELERRWGSKYFGIWGRIRRFGRLHTPLSKRHRKRTTVHDLAIEGGYSDGARVVRGAPPAGVADVGGDSSSYSSSEHDAGEELDLYGTPFDDHPYYRDDDTDSSSSSFSSVPMSSTDSAVSGNALAIGGGEKVIYADLATVLGPPDGGD